ncbi:MAG: strawberry notch family protein [Bacteroidia bacterium]|nr:strawberry notch family protein [Bacteroidia bacterium]
MIFTLGALREGDVPEVKLRLNRSSRRKHFGKIGDSKDVAEFIRKVYKRGEIELQEQFVVLYLNRANDIIGYYRHAVGGITGTVADVRIILAAALKSASTSIIIAHNHPSGNLRPSEQDILLTRKIKESAATMDISVLDHIIITKDGYYSFADEGLLGIEEIFSDAELGFVVKDKLKPHLNKVIQGNALDTLKDFPDNSIDCVITSPPYWQLRDYGWKGQWGLEKTFEEYLQNLWALMDEIQRVLKPKGTVWINLGDTYGTQSGTGRGTQYVSKSTKHHVENGATLIKGNAPHKSQLLIPHRFAIGCMERGWIVRNDIILAKKNSMPESVKDRFSKKHEFVFLMVKSKEYFFDLDSVREPHKAASLERTTRGWNGHREKGSSYENMDIKKMCHEDGKNPGDIADFWVVNNKGGKDKHYAKYSSDMLTKPILAGCPKGGVVLDPFCGTGSTGVRAIELGRKFIGIDGKKEYCGIAEKKLKDISLNGTGPLTTIPKWKFVGRIEDDLQKKISHTKRSIEKLATTFGIHDKNLVKELTELAIVRRARVLAHAQGAVRERYASIVELYKNQVNLSHRTSQSILLQQYSTPAPIGFLAGIFVGADKGISVFEPSAGNGLLTIAGIQQNIIVNELDNTRRENLQTQGFKQVLSRDATKPFPEFYQKMNAVITNPPFGTLDTEIMFDTFPIKTLDHLMALRALDCMKHNGKAAIIIGGHTQWDEKGRIQAGKNRIFFNYLYSRYNVVDVINIDGSLYSRQGTSFDVRLILIDGRKQNPQGAAPIKNRELSNAVKTFDALYERVIDAIDNSGKAELQRFNSLKQKYTDVILLLSTGSFYETFGEDAIKTSKILGTILAHRKGVPVTGFPIHSLDTYLPRLVRSGNKVAVADELPNPKEMKQNISQLEKEAMELQRQLGFFELGSPYIPASAACVVLNTQVPDSMSFETQKALDLIRDEVGGDIDEFVRHRLNFRSKTELCKSLSAEQIDAVAMAIYNIEARGQGMIIGDQTGIGKGRVAASMIRYGVQQGLKPIFITEKANLFSDIYRDLAAIGSAHLVPFIVNGRESKTDIKDEDGNIVYQALPANEQQRIFEGRKVPAKFHFVVGTYSQFNSPEKKPEKPNFLREIAQGNIIIMDEAHNSSGSSNTGEFMQSVVADTKGVVFLSATFAKRPDNMPIYAMKTAISDANMTKDELVEAIIRGGVALQEVLSSQLVAEGQMLRRERSFEGVEVNYITLDQKEQEHKAVADNITEILRDIIGFQKNFVDKQVEDLDKIAAAEGKEVELREGTSQAGVDNQPYFSKVFNVINQMLFSIKAEAVAERAIARLKEGKKPVIAFASTMGSFIEQMENDKGVLVADGDVINADFTEVLKRGLEGILRYTEKDVDGNSISKKFEISDLSVEAQAEYRRIMEKVKTASTGITISPIDIVIKKIQDAGYSVAEVTGRKYELQINPKTNKGLILQRKRINTNDAFRQFNNNEVDVLMINQSGSTGASAHAIPTAKVPASQVKQRAMIVLQAELDINTEVQKRGRINRTGQILKPIYDYVNSAIPAEKRLMMMLQKKLKSLDANTTSNQKQSTKILDVPDFLNKYGDKIVKEYLIENPEVNELLNDPLHLKTTKGDDKETVEDAAHKVSGRVAVLSTKMQQDFYNEISERYNDFTEYLKQIGDYDLEVEAMDLQAERINWNIIKMGKGGDSTFGDDSILEAVKANVLKKPFSKNELDNLLKESLSGKDAIALQAGLQSEYELFVAKRLEEETKEVNEKYDELIKEVPNEKKILKLKSEKEKLNAIKEREQELDTARHAQLEQTQTSFNNRSQYLKRIFKYFHIGKRLNYPVQSYSEGQELVLATFLGFIIDKKKKNPYAPSAMKLRFAIANSNKYIAIPASYSDDITAIMGASTGLPETERVELLNEWESAIKSNIIDRKTRHIITGNLLQAFSDFKGKLVSYTTLDGETKKGILMPDNWIPAEHIGDKVVVPIGKAITIVKSLANGAAIYTNNDIGIFRQGEGYKVIVPSSRAKGGEIYLDKDILELVDGKNFEKVSDKMVATFPFKQIEPFVEILQSKFSSAVTLTNFQFDMIKDEKHKRSSSRKKIELPPKQDESELLKIYELEAEALALELELLAA